MGFEKFKTNFELKYLLSHLQNLDKLLEKREITIGEYIQIGLLVKVLQSPDGKHD